MTKALEAAARAIADVWEKHPEYQICTRGLINPRSGAPTFHPAMGGPSNAEFAKAAVLAFLENADREAAGRAIYERWPCAINWLREDDESRADWIDYSDAALLSLKKQAEA